MTKAANDDYDPWTSIGLQTNLILNKLRCAQTLRDLVSSEEKEEDKRGSNPKPSEKDQQRNADHEEYVAARVREIGIWEKKQKGM